MLTNRKTADNSKLPPASLVLNLLYLGGRLAVGNLQTVTGNAMISISKNKWTFYGRLVFIIPLIWLFFKPIQNSFNNQLDRFQIGLLLFFLIFVIALGFFLFLGLLTRPIYVTADYSTQQIAITTISHGIKAITLNDLKGYSSTKLWTMNKNYPGIIMYLKNNTKIELSEFNLESLDPLIEYLKRGQIKWYGDETSWFPFRPFRFRFDKMT